LGDCYAKERYPVQRKRQEKPREGMEKERRLDLAFTISLPNRQHWAASIFCCGVGTCGSKVEL
jgi:hypothetical protein